LEKAKNPDKKPQKHEELINCLTMQAQILEQVYFMNK